ncbi:hypothetical protein ACK3SF_01715 [Candidatus Nanosalina sp. VS9-1]|uniref:hypothetical protein n=1 Tax=Candidatus Nanosalina sp. VS9-1 TaxID=3388566 RepID=UPI0039E05DDC
MKVEDASEFFDERFEVDIDNIEGLELEKISGDFWLVSEKEDRDIDSETRGIRALRDTGKFLKPTTYALQLLSDEISRNNVELDKEELKEILDGEMVPAEASEEGYVAIVFEGKVVGCGLYKDEVVSSRISKGRGEELLSFL